VKWIGQWAEQNWDWILSASLILNVILAVLLFFKSALNSMLFHWYQEHRKRQDKTREILLELNTRMSSFHSDYFMLLVNMGLSHLATTPRDRALAEETFNEAGKTMQSTNEFFDRYDLEFPEPIRALVSELRRAIKIPVESVRGVLSREEILGRSDEVLAVTQRIQAEVQQLVR